MAWRSEKNGDQTDIVIDGFEKGIADSAETGIADIRNANITSSPTEAAVNFSMQGVTLPPTGQTGISFSAAAATDIITVSSTAGYYNGMAIEVKTTSLPPTVDSLIVAGGGGGGAKQLSAGEAGGGGGAGGLIYTTGTSVVAGGVYPVVIGTGGAGGIFNNPTGNQGVNGLDSSFDGITASGGGGGGSGINNATGNPLGLAGGSGGGAGGANTGGPFAGGTGIVGQGHNGGTTPSGASLRGSGGGGASTAGTTASVGGDGTANSITGSSVTYAGGGGGGANSGGGAGSAGGAGGGGAGGGGTSSNAAAGTVNTGGGGGGAGDGTAGAGGSGVVIVRYLTGSITATGGSMTTSGAYTIHTFNSGGNFLVSAVNPAQNQIYYIGNLTATTFKLYTTPALSTPVNILGDITGTFDVPSFGNPFDSCLVETSNIESGTGQISEISTILDSSGSLWFLGNGITGTTILNTLYFYGNIGHSTVTTAGSLGVAFWLGYVFVFCETEIDYISFNAFFSTGTINWVYGWKTITATQSGHKALPATDDALYFCNNDAVGSILEAAGSTFDPTDSVTYTYNDTALSLPQYDKSTCLAQLGVTLLVGGIKQFVYPWDRVSPSFSYPIIVPEAFTHRIVSTNQNAYLFSGKRGRIYITNGANMDFFKKIPDQISGTQNPYYSWGDAIYMRNQLYFSISATSNGGVSVDNFSGVWAIDLDSEAFRLENSLSYGSYAGSVPVIVPMGNLQAAGNAYYVGWVNGSSVGGIDYSSSTPYSNYETYIDTDIIPIGTYYQSQTDQQIEYKLSKPLVAGEGVKIFWRGNLTDSFIQVTSITAVTGQISGAGQVNFQKQQWVQLRVQYSSTATLPSYTRLREVRIR